MSILSDSGFEEDFHSPPPPSTHRPASQAQEDAGRYPLVADWQLSPDYDENCFNTQKRNEREFLTSDCLAHQPQVNAEARCKLVSWLIAVHRHFELSFESCCLAVNIMDRFLGTTAVASDCFQLLGVTSLLIASKQVEVCSPRIKQLLSLCCGTFSREQLCNLECLVLLRLGFRLAAPTLAFFLHHYTLSASHILRQDPFICSRLSKEMSTNHGLTQDSLVSLGQPQETSMTCHSSQDLTLRPSPQQQHVEELRRSTNSVPHLQLVERCGSLARRICELSLADYAFNCYSPSVTAQSAVRLALELLGMSSASLQGCSPVEGPDLRLPQGGDIEKDLLQNCTEKLKLLVSLNQTALQTLMDLQNSKYREDFIE
ncbi:cyclin-O [Alosa alosa]|uniref:cyclin-O n=1 Tax=Alosa alosa TaxID=278164 RepID=UPI0020150566|nr:cyclin-O [Alosa alosa]